MKIFRNILITLFVAYLILFIATFFTGYTVTIPISKKREKILKVRNGNIFQPMKNIDFKKGEVVVYLTISTHDWHDMKEGLPKVTCLRTSDSNLINKLKTLRFRVTGGDVSTSESGLEIVQNGVIIFDSGIVLDHNNEGLESSHYGWLEPEQKDGLTQICRQFKRVYCPVTFI